MRKGLLGEILWFFTAIALLALCFVWKGESEEGTPASASGAVLEKIEPPKLALTFDDGPSIYTESLLEGLKERGVKASFFLLGKNIQGKEDVVKEIYQEGHLIGNHTFNHVQLTKLSQKEAQAEIEKTSSLIYTITGQYTTFVRPPYGEWREDLEYAVTMLPVFWSVDPMDWNTDNADAVVKKVESKVEEGDIILLHDSSKSSVQAALRIVDDLTAKGYEFVTVEEMLLD
ncbi:MAG: polysaccharide deacetylase family protein [Blautia sp.]|jgi:peptidoglycan/xylan/chitin deacetylase (PgdA/CDA1 family)